MSERQPIWKGGVDAPFNHLPTGVGYRCRANADVSRVVLVANVQIRNWFVDGDREGGALNTTRVVAVHGVGDR